MSGRFSRDHRQLVRRCCAEHPCCLRRWTKFSGLYRRYSSASNRLRASRQLPSSRATSCISIRKSCCRSHASYPAQHLWAAREKEGKVALGRHTSCSFTTPPTPPYAPLTHAAHPLVGTTFVVSLVQEARVARAARAARAWAKVRCSSIDVVMRSHTRIQNREARIPARPPSPPLTSAHHHQIQYSNEKERQRHCVLVCAGKGKSGGKGKSDGKGGRGKGKG